ncbi:MAG: vitamin K epoxide reductase family protein [Pirellula sp.]
MHSESPESLSAAAFKRFVLRLIALIALVLSSAALADSLFEGSPFCGFQSECDQVVYSSYGNLGGIPLTVIGCMSFGSFLLLTLIPSARAATWIRPAAILAGVCGLGLIGVQWRILGHFCQLCLFVDLTAIMLAVVEFALPGSSAKWNRSSYSRWQWWILGGGLMTIAPLWYSWTQPPPKVPQEVMAYRQPGRISVVIVTDFDCPYCRIAHPIVERFLQENRNTLHVVRLAFPVQDQPQGQIAARAFFAAAAQGKDVEMAASLFATTELTPEYCRQQAERLGLNLDAFDRVVQESSTGEHLDNIRQWATSSGQKGLPLIWIQNEVIVGIPTPEKLMAALRRASD